MKDIIIPLVCAVFASTGFWTLINNIWQAYNKKKSNETKLMMGLAYDRILTLASFYIGKGTISADEYHDLDHYLYEPYKAMGGNGTAQRMMQEVSKLPIRRDDNDNEQ